MHVGAYIHLKHQGQQQSNQIRVCGAERLYSSREVYLLLDQDISCDVAAPDL